MNPAVYTSHFLRRLWLLLALLLPALGAGAEENLPTAPQGRVSDYASLLDPSQRQALTAQLTHYELSMRRPNGGGPQIVLAILPDLGGTPIEDVAVRLAGRWKIGSTEDDGVLLVVGVKEHEVRIEVGYGVEARLPDAVVARIIRELMVPRLRGGDFVGGLRAGAAGIHQALVGAAVTGQDEFEKGPATAPAPPQVDRVPLRWLVGGGVVLGLLLLLLIFGGPGVRGFFAGMLVSSLLGGGRRGGRGGFSGGGGSFGGGGATGKW